MGRLERGALAIGLQAAGCAGIVHDRPVDKFVVADVELEGAHVIDPDELLDRLATAKSPKFLQLFRGIVFEYEVFDEDVLGRDLQRVERFYRARGYYEAKVTAARVHVSPDGLARVLIRVYEGAPVRTRTLRLRGIERLPFDTAAAALAARELETGDIFDEDEFEHTKEAIRRSLANRGYAFAKVRAHAKADLARHVVDVDLEVEPGPLAVYGPVDIVGLRDVPEYPVRANLDLRKGEAYSEADLEDARSALHQLGVFASVEIQQSLDKPQSRTVPIKVVVREAELRTLRLGGGTQIDQVRLSTHLRAGWVNRNFLGGLRRLTIETRPGVVLYPTRIPSGESSLRAPTDLLPENRLRVELRQPSFIEGRTTGFLTGDFDIYAVLFQREPVPDEPVLGFRELRGTVGVERAFFEHHLHLTPSYNAQAIFPFTYLNDLPEGLERAVVSYPELQLALDFRDDPIRPHSGVYLSNSLQVAGYAFGGDASDVKVRPEVRTYVPISKRVTFATRATLGFLFPDPESYGSTLSADTSLIDAADPAVVRDQQLLLLRAFYSGGPSSNRGYGFRGVGPHGPLGLLAPGATLRCEPNDTSPACIRPLGGLTLWEASLEVRFPLFGPLDGAVFLDASDVTRQVADIRFDFPHLATGLGFRYATPIGPVRTDFGYRLPFAQEVGAESLRPSEGDPGDIAGLPIAIHLALGEAF